MSPFIHMHTLKVGQPAPFFSLQSHEDTTCSLKHFKGSWLVLFFYPKDNTPGCTTEVCRFRDYISEFQEMNASIIGINTDNCETHKGFAFKQQLSFPLLCDPDGVISDIYQSLFKLGPIKFCKRRTFIINPAGDIAKIYHRISPATHAEQIVHDLKDLQNEK